MGKIAAARRQARQGADPIAVRQWVAAVSIALEAEQAGQRGSDVDRLVALVLADTASEAALALIARTSDEPLDTESHGEYLKHATAVAKLDADLVSEVRAIRKLRNGGIHSGADIGALDVSRALANARTLLDVYVPKRLREARRLGPGGGIGHAVGALLPAHPIGRHLEAAQVAIPKDPRAALEQIAAVMWLVQEYSAPRLPTRSRSVQFNALMPHRLRRDDVRQTLGESLSTDLVRLSQRTDMVADWVVPLALGVAPRDFATMIESLPGAVRYEDGHFEFRWNDKPLPSVDDARRGLDRVAHLVLRLWSSDALVVPRPPNPPRSR
jgi:hypothetical protein